MIKFCNYFICFNVNNIYFDGLFVCFFRSFVQCLLACDRPDKIAPQEVTASQEMKNELQLWVSGHSRLTTSCAQETVTFTRLLHFLCFKWQILMQWPCYKSFLTLCHLSESQQFCILFEHEVKLTKRHFWYKFEQINIRNANRLSRQLLFNRMPNISLYLILLPFFFSCGLNMFKWFAIRLQFQEEKRSKTTKKGISTIRLNLEIKQRIPLHILSQHRTCRFWTVGTLSTFIIDSI